MLEFHKAAKVGMVALLVRHDPARIIVDLMLGRLFGKRFQKENILEKKYKKNKSKEQNNTMAKAPADTAVPTQ